MKRLFVLVFVALFCYGVAFAVPAFPGKYTYTQPDGSTIVLEKHGDEFFSWITNEAGEVVEKDETGYYRPVSTAKYQQLRTAGRARSAAVNAMRRGPALTQSGTTEQHFLVILVAFSDVAFQSTNTPEAFSNLLNLNGYNANGATGSAQDYYYENSDHQFRPIFDVYGPVTLANNVAHYGAHEGGNNDTCPEDAVKEGCVALDSQIDFSQYDSDGDGEVDLVFMYYAGYGEADYHDNGNENTIWPHQWALRSAGITLKLDGKTINKYACSNERIGSGSLEGSLCGIGTACHEFGHALGLPDLYDTDYNNHNGEAGGLYYYSLMCSGSYNNNGRTPPYLGMEERIMLGWQDPSKIEEITSAGNYSLTSVSNNKAYKSATDKSGEYFLYECRSATGWDTYVTEPGLIIYHVDKSTREVEIWGGSSNISVTPKSLWDDWDRYNSINENGSHPCFYVIPAGNPTSLNCGKSYKNMAFPGKAGATSFTGTSWNGVASLVRLTDIAFVNDEVTFTVPPATLRNRTIEVSPVSYSIGSNVTLSLTGDTTEVTWYCDDEPLDGNTFTITSAAHVIEAHFTVGSEEKIVELTLTAQ